MATFEPQHAASLNVSLTALQMLVGSRRPNVSYQQLSKPLYSCYQGPGEFANGSCLEMYLQHVVS